MTTQQQRELPEYSQGVCHDGATILKDGQPMTPDEIVAELQAAQAQQEDSEADDALAADYANCLSMLGCDLDAGEDIPLCLSEMLDELLNPRQPAQQVPDEIQELARHNVIVRRCLDEHRYNHLPLTDCLFAAVKALAESEQQARKVAVECMSRSPISPIFTNTSEPAQQEAPQPDDALTVTWMDGYHRGRSENAAQQVPQGWKLVEKKTCFVLQNGREVIATLAGPNAESYAATIAALLTTPDSEDN